MAAQRGGPGDPEIRALEEKNEGTETEKSRPRVSYKGSQRFALRGLHLMLPAPTCYNEAEIILLEGRVTGS